MVGEGYEFKARVWQALLLSIYLEDARREFTAAVGLINTRRGFVYVL